jgi:hypothetical protein
VTDTDPVAAELDQIRRFLDGSNEDEWYAAGRMLLSAVDKALALHSVVPWYCAASDCEHPEPENDMSDEWQDWDDDHVNGSGGILICRLTIEDSFCPECTHLKYGDEEPEGDDFVSAPCATRSAVLAELTGEGNGR